MKYKNMNCQKEYQDNCTYLMDHQNRRKIIEDHPKQSTEKTNQNQRK